MKNILIGFILASVSPATWAVCGFVTPVTVYSAKNGDMVFSVTSKSTATQVDDDTGYIGLRLGVTAILHASTESSIGLSNSSEKRQVVDFTKRRLAFFKQKVEAESPLSYQNLKAPLEKLDRLLSSSDGAVNRWDLSNALDDVEKNFGKMRVQAKTRSAANSPWGADTDVAKIGLPDFHDTCSYVRLNPQVKPTPASERPPQSAEIIQ